MSTSDHDHASSWERKALERIALEGIAEQRRSRRWGIFFKLLGFIYFTLFLVALGDWDGSVDKLGDGVRHTALVQINGVIQAKGDASADRIVSALQAAFENKGTQGGILSINTPGGSPVQAGIIFDEIRRLRAQHPKVPLYVVVEDYCTSGGYYIAAAADRIFVNKASIVGSIGVIMEGFGFTGAMNKLGIERRMMISGQNKGFLDPFSQEDPVQRAHAQKMLDEIHQQFIDAVRQGRGQRLKETPDMFSGLMWTGARGIELGLADDYGTVDSVARDVIKVEDVRDYTVKQTFAERFSSRFGANLVDSMAARALHLATQMNGR